MHKVVTTILPARTLDSQYVPFLGKTEHGEKGHQQCRCNTVSAGFHDEKSFQPHQKNPEIFET